MDTSKSNILDLPAQCPKSEELVYSTIYFGHKFICRHLTLGKNNNKLITLPQINTHNSHMNKLMIDQSLYLPLMDCADIIKFFQEIDTRIGITEKDQILEIFDATKIKKYEYVPLLSVRDGITYLRCSTENTEGFIKVNNEYVKSSFYYKEALMNSLFRAVLQFNIITITPPHNLFRTYKIIIDLMQLYVG